MIDWDGARLNRGGVRSERCSLTVEPKQNLFRRARGVTMARLRVMISVVTGRVLAALSARPLIGHAKEEAMLTRVLLALATLAAVLPSAPASAQTADKLKVAISQRGFWDSSFLEFAQKEGFLKAANLDVEFFYTEGGGQTLQIITSGSVDVAMSNGLLGTIGAYTQGAPIRVISAQMTGAHELFWYVKSDSPIRSLKDAAGDKPDAFSAPAPSPHLVLLALLNQEGSKAKPASPGSRPA